MRVTTTWTNNNPMTIYNQLAGKLGREPTSVELKAEVQRIFTDVMIDRAEQGKLKHQRR